MNRCTMLWSVNRRAKARPIVASIPVLCFVAVRQTDHTITYYILGSGGGAG